ncbi:hypothetical protein Nepgr_020615 [Nepenthes gracilis]|uniref:Uncharacterized protein n=1 Tax=Nepenthes gracilis TaxID=150966 RepID=A0AAD3SXA4_NEPGR|nr:hypothetical protein Nepgr_020615 [Nepenthes gracilis]
MKLDNRKDDTVDFDAINEAGNKFRKEIDMEDLGLSKREWEKEICDEETQRIWIVKDEENGNVEIGF